jgi:hypothetical protein
MQFKKVTLAQIAEMSCGNVKDGDQHRSAIKISLRQRVLRSEGTPCV